MRKYLLTISVILILSIDLLLAQPDNKFVKPDYTKIKEIISNKDSENYYPKLLTRLNNNDTLLTKEQYKLLYFGYVYQDSYDPYWVPKYSKILNEYYKKPSIDNNDCDSIIKYCKLSIIDFPFDLQQTKMLGFAYHKKGDNANERLWFKRNANLMGTIMSTGRGLDCGNSISVIVINHEYELLKQFNFQLVKQSLTSDKCDYMELQPNRPNIAGLYFDTKIIFEMAYKSKILKK